MDIENMTVDQIKMLINQKGKEKCFKIIKIKKKKKGFLKMNEFIQKITFIKK